MTPFITARERPSRSRALLSTALIGLLAILPRILFLGSFVTSDEANFWLQRSATFLQAIRTGDYAATAISTHPGVTTMWLGSAGILLREALLGWHLVEPGFSTRLALMQLPVALVNALAVLLGYRLLRRLLPARSAFLAALLWALDPFVIGYSRLLHVDALAGTFSTLSLLAACVYWHHTPRWRWLALSAICAGLAVLSKSPALALLPIIGACAGVAAWRAARTPDSTVAVDRQRLLRGLAPLFIWLAISLATALILWPALWAAPRFAYAQLRSGVQDEGAQPHMLGNFFLGREDDAPGLLFYPVALVLRLTPWALVGLLALPWAWRRTRPRTRSDLAILVGFALLMLIALSPFPKKFNRYLVPIFPVLDILAAWSLMCGVRWIGARLRRRHMRRLVQPALLGMLLVAALLTTTVWTSYAIDYYNPLLGGARVGERTFSTGWGEGLAEAALWLNQQPDITGVLIASTQVPTLQPYLRFGAQAVTPADALPPKAGYVVLYIRDFQSGVLPSPFDRFLQEPPLYQVQIHGVTYVRIYQVPPQFAQPRPARFGATIRLRGYTVVDPGGPGQAARLLLFWATDAAPQEDYTLFAHLIGRDDTRFAQVDLPLATRQWAANRYWTTELALPIAAEVPAGQYQLVGGLYQPADGRRLPLDADGPLRAAGDGADALSLMDLAIP
jgi:hypothetical protein